MNLTFEEIMKQRKKKTKKDDANQTSQRSAPSDPTIVSNLNMSEKVVEPEVSNQTVPLIPTTQIRVQQHKLVTEDIGQVSNSTMDEKVVEPEVSNLPKPVIIPEVELSEFDYRMLEFLTAEFASQGITTVRHNMRNPYVEWFAKMSYTMLSLDTFKDLANRGVVKRTKYSNQFHTK